MLPPKIEDPSIIATANFKEDSSLSDLVMIKVTHSPIKKEVKKLEINICTPTVDDAISIMTEPKSEIICWSDSKPTHSSKVDIIWEEEEP